MAIIRGTPQADDLVGTAAADRILGFEGDDLLRGLGGNDELFGQAGADRLFGAAGNDTLNGGPGNDRLNGGAGNDILIPGVGRDQLGGGGGSDTFLMDNLRGGVNTILDFTPGADTIDVSGLLADFQAGDDLSDFVRILDRPAGTVIGLDQTGSGGPFINLVLLPGVENLQLSAADLGLPGNDTVGGGSGPPDEITVISSTAAGALQDAARSAGTVQMNKSVSDSGTIVAFESEAGNLVQNDGDGSDIFVKNAVTGSIQLASTNGAGTAANDVSFDPAVSGNGRYVAFASEATNLVTGDTNNATDVFRKDLVTGDVVRVSTTGAGQQAAFGPSGAFGGTAISDDGNLVAFISNATNLVAGDTNGLADVFVKNLTTGVIVRANTLAGGGQQTEGFPTEMALSGNGNFLAFATSASLVAADTNGFQDIYVKNLTTGALTLASATEGGTVAGGISNTPTLSDDGRFVAFESTAINLVAGDTNNSVDVFVKDLQTDDVVRASTNSGGTQQTGSAATMAPVISGDGQVVVFQSDAGNLVAGDANLAFDIFAKNLGTDETVRVSLGEGGAEGSSASGWPAVTDDGGFVAYETQADELVGEATGVNQVLLTPVNFTGPQVAAAALKLDDVLDDGDSVGGAGSGPAAGTAAAEFAPAIAGLLVEDLLGALPAEAAG